ncbi:MAG: VCBS repeat-containing protein [Planctomycetes bacterium]|nr:VCBS repeat-containing protein [Planctomycetota bacterium]
MKRRLLLFVLADIVLVAAALAWWWQSNRRPVPQPGDPRSAGTLWMAEELAEIAADVDFKRPDGYMLNAQRMPWRREQLEDSLGSDDEPRKHRLLARELVQVGDPRGALAEFDAAEKSWLARFGKPDAEFVADMKRWRAITWLRLGEVENCIGHHACASCIAPIAAGGQHVEREGSEHAYALYLELCEEFPDDVESRWLLNLAAMTLGRWPDQVPEKWRLDPKVLESQWDCGRFRDVAPAAGLGHSTLSGGVCLEDFDGDGLIDVFCTAIGLEDQAQLFLCRVDGEGIGTFVERTREAGLIGETGGLNCCHADYDNDGDADVLILRGAWMGEIGRMPNSLLRNRGDATFEDVTEEAGLLSYHPTQTAQWADLDGDGWLDLVIGNETQDPDEEHACELFLSNRDGTFREVAEAVGADVVGWVKGVAAGDIDDDGRIDLYYSKREAANVLLRNVAGGAERLHFVDITAQAGVAEPVMSFPAWFFDYDNDGRQDLFAAGNGLFTSDSISEVGNLMFGRELSSVPRLYHNDGGGRFSDVTKAAGVDRAVLTMGSNFGDLDNDGWTDFYLGNGAPSLRALLPNRMFRNDGNGRFIDVTTAGGFGHLQKGHGIAWADLDGDGDQDVYLEAGGALTGDAYPTVVFENPGHGKHWITLRFQGTKANRAAVGARVRVDIVTPGGPRSIHHVVGTGGSFGSSSLQAEIGLCDATAIAAIDVRWPGSQTRSRFAGVAMDRAWLAIEGEAVLQPSELKRYRFPEGDDCCTPGNER